VGTPASTPLSAAPGTTTHGDQSGKPCRPPVLVHRMGHVGGDRGGSDSFPTSVSVLVLFAVLGAPVVGGSAARRSASAASTSVAAWRPP